jgi:uncharacterized Tic20 family protein
LTILKQVFGVEFRNRITHYVTYIFVCIVILVIVLASTLITRSSVAQFGMDVETKTLLVCVFFCVVVMMLWVLAMV